MKDFLYSIILAFSFFTVIPLPIVEWTKKRLKFLPLLMPFVGLLIGILAYGLYLLLVNASLSNYASSIILALFFLIITGGVHNDGLMDTADAYFSRKKIEEKLVIMKDSRLGVFAVMTFVGMLLFKTALFYEIFCAGKEIALALLLIPILSRIFQAYILCCFPCAKKDGLANTFREAVVPKTPFVLGLYFIVVIILVYNLLGIKNLLLPIGLVLFTIFYYYFSLKNFGGITGDVVGAFVELAEVLLLTILIIIQLN
ncbi:MAG: adenosylcobinamide-GDP ribazoletransferase [Peptococcaceae bacterium]|nr:adenosylcobinamide-GDP ribazoletransferase [Peptococcaceae bacterium]